ncbi:MAG: phosphatidylglycerophosphatase A family protein [Candidatus Binataceae bacterium]
MRSLTLFLATGFYSGYAPRAPGTAGSVVGAIVWWVIFVPLLRASPAAAVLLFAILFAAGCVISGQAEEILGQPDSPMIVIDEVLGMVATLFFHPMTWPFLIGGFIAFRFFDILKPPPARQIDRYMKGGTAVMLDDLAAAIYASLVLEIASLVL